MNQVSTTTVATAQAQGIQIAVKHQTYGAHQIQSVVTQLLTDSRWFEVEPEPFDVYTVTVKDEVTLPEPLGLDGLRNPVGFDYWVASIGFYFYQELTPEQQESLRPYFTRGLRPSEALEPIKEDGLDLPDSI